jgi:hypothetical protein
MLIPLSFSSGLVLSSRYVSEGHSNGDRGLEKVSTATLVGIAEMYIPALLVREAALPSRFFMATLSVSQLIFFSAVGSMMIDMFREIPVRARELIALFLMRTAVLIPLLAAITALLKWAGGFE